MCQRRNLKIENMFIIKFTVDT